MLCARKFLHAVLSLIQLYLKLIKDCIMVLNMIVDLFYVFQQATFWRWIMAIESAKSCDSRGSVIHVIQPEFSLTINFGHCFS